MRRGIEQLLPTITRTSQWKDRKKQIEWPLFPGYCFARFSAGQRLIVLQTPGVIEIVGGGSRPEPIEEEEMEALRRMLSSRKHYDPYPYLNEGMPVEVIRGPLQGVKGKLVRKATHCRLVISINLIRQAASVEIDSEDVSPISLESAS